MKRGKCENGQETSLRFGRDATVCCWCGVVSLRDGRSDFYVFEMTLYFDKPLERFALYLPLIEKDGETFIDFAKHPLGLSPSEIENISIVETQHGRLMKINVKPNPKSYYGKGDCGDLGPPEPRYGDVMKPCLSLYLGWTSRLPFESPINKSGLRFQLKQDVRDLTDYSSIGDRRTGRILSLKAFKIPMMIEASSDAKFRYWISLRSYKSTLFSPLWDGYYEVIFRAP
ncbi:MAG: hypothetical protein AOA65_0460 [Candidatus Bathyarchaeota archaeon BA1]|nr:MAG: hypothetical protein AOA65_0460 [Candidatus Bathyarchaeota archaeon BA1]